MRLRKVLVALLTGTLVLTGLSACGDSSGTATEVAGEDAAKDAVYSADEAYVNGGYMTFTVYADHSGDYQVDFNSNAETIVDVDIRVNGISSGSIQIPSDGNTISLNKGINTIKFEYADAMEGIKLHDCVSMEDKGLTAAYVTYEAEACTTNATVLEDSRAIYDIATEASGRSAVKLESEGQYIKFELQEDTNAIVLRYCVPDNQEGTGETYTLNISAGGNPIEATVTSYHTWVYGELPFTNTPDDKGHNFFDDVTIMLDDTYPAGTEVTISKEAGNTAPYYIVDLIETELIEAALSQPENSLSITQYGAVANDGEDDTQALLDCIDAAVAEGKEVWLPEGEFTFSQSRIVINNDGVTIRGAGMWHTTITGEGAAFYIKGNNTAFYDFKMQGTAVVRRDDVDPAAFEIASGTHTKENFTLQNIWIEHYKVGAWTYNISGVHVVGCRIRNTFADGINLCKATCNSLVEQSSFRGTGDDSVAMWSQSYSDINNIVRYNTISLPDLANCIAIYGGKDITIYNNVISDVITEGSGINISTNFSPADFGEKIIVEGNLLNRCGSLNDISGSKIGAIWFNTVKDFDNHAEVIVRDNVVIDSSYQGMSFSGIGTISNVLIENNTIENSGTYAVESTSSVRGAAVVRNNQMTGNELGDVNTNNGQNFTLTLDDAGSQGVDPIVIAIAVFAGIIVAGVGVVTVVFKKKPEKTKEQ